MGLLAGMESWKDPDIDWLGQLASSTFSPWKLRQGLLQVEQLESLSYDEVETDRAWHAARRALNGAFRFFLLAM